MSLAEILNKNGELINPNITCTTLNTALATSESLFTNTMYINKNNTLYKHSISDTGIYNITSDVDINLLSFSSSGLTNCSLKSSLDAEFNTIMSIVDGQRQEIEELKTFNNNLREFIKVLRSSIFLENPVGSLQEFDYNGVIPE